jgi:uncharacterized protein YcfL
MKRSLSKIPTMKKLLTLVLLSLLLIQCSTNEIVTPMEETNDPAIFNMTMDGNYFVPESSGKWYLSDEAGELLAQGALINNQQTPLEIEYDPTMRYDATIYFEIFTAGIQLHVLYTYEDVTPGDYFITAVQGYNPNGDEITLTLTNAGNDLEILTTSGFVTVEQNNNDGGTYILSGDLISSPGHNYAAFKSPNDNLPRYSWTGYVNGDTNITADYTTLPFVEEAITITLPSNETSGVSIRGFMDSDPSGVSGVSHMLQKESTEDGTTLYEALLPNGVFDDFWLSASYKFSNDDKTHRFIKLSESLEQNVPAATLDFNVNSNTISNFSVSATGEYDAYNTTFVYSNSAQDVTVFYDIFGKGASEVNFSKANLFNNLFADDPEITSALLPPAERIFLTNYSHISTYNEFLHTPLLNGPLLVVDETVESVFIF